MRRVIVTRLNKFVHSFTRNELILSNFYSKQTENRSEWNVVVNFVNLNTNHAGLNRGISSLQSWSYPLKSEESMRVSYQFQEQLL